MANIYIKLTLHIHNIIHSTLYKYVYNTSKNYLKRKSLNKHYTITITIGVRLGYQYHMRLVYAHFPISCNIDGGNKCEVRNYMGSKNTFKLKMEDGVSIENGPLKGELILKGK